MARLVLLAALSLAAGASIAPHCGAAMSLHAASPARDAGADDLTTTINPALAAAGAG